MENTEKKVLIDVKILDNFVTTKKNADEAKKALNDFIKSGEKNDKLQRELAQNLAKANNEFKEARTQLEAASKSQDMLAAAGEKANKTLGEMQRELRALKNTPLDFGDPKQVREVEQAMADLTAEIDDYKTKIKGLDTGEFAQNMAGVMEAGSAVLQITGQVTGALGIEGETFKKLQDSTVELIAVTQAFGVITEALDKKKLSLVAANIKNISSMAAEKIGAVASAGAHILLGKSVDVASTKFKMLRGAIIATGLGALLVVIGLLIANWDKLTAGIGDSVTQQKKMDVAIESTNLQLSNLKSKTDFDISIARASGASTKALRAMAIESAMAAEKITSSNLMIVRSAYAVGNATKEQYDDATKAYQDAVENYTNTFKQSLIEERQEETDQRKKANDLKIENAKKTAKAEIDIQNVKSQTIIDKQNEIAGNEKKSYTERLAALSISESEQIKIIERNRNHDLKNKDLTESERKSITEKAAYDIAKIESDTQKSITEIQAKGLDKRLKDEADALEAKKQQLANKQAADLQDLSKEYANSLKKAKYASDVVAIQEKYEKDKLAIAQKYREQDFNESIAAMQAQLDLLPADADARIEIEKAIADAKSKYAQESVDIAVKANEDIGKSHEASVKKQEELEKQLKEKKEELYAQLQTTIQDITNGVFERKNQELDEETAIIAEQYDAQIKAAEGNEQKQQDLEDEKKARLDQQEKEKRKLIREQAIVERAFQTFSIGVDTTRSVGEIQLNAATLASNPITAALAPLALAQIPVAIGIGALQLASIMAAPLPKAQYGKVFKGRSHAQGGIPVEVEGDEIIMTKGVYRNPMLRELASMINQAGGGISFSNPNQSAVFATGGFASTFSDGGYAMRNANRTDGDLTKKDIEDLKEAIKGLKIYATIEDIRRADENYVKIEDGANY